MERTNRADRPNRHDRPTRRHKRPSFRVRGGALIESGQRGSRSFNEIQVTLDPNLARELGLFLEENQPENQAVCALGFALLNLCDELMASRQEPDREEINGHDDRRYRRH